MIETIVKCDACGIKQDYEASLREHWYEVNVHVRKTSSPACSIREVNFSSSTRHACTVPCMRKLIGDVVLHDNVAPR
jgi:hypothetical protein